MTQKIKGVLVIAKESAKKMCEYCGNIAETRPYGQNNEEICFDCGMKIGNLAITQTKFKECYII